MRWYVIADRQSGALTLPLLGPYDTAREAGAMLRPVTNAVRKHRADLAHCIIGVVRIAWSKPGHLDLAHLDPADVLEAHRSLIGSLKRS